MEAPTSARRPILESPWSTRLVLILSFLLLLQLAHQQLVAMWSTRRPGLLFALASPAAAQSVDLSWHPPNQTVINNLTAVLDRDRKSVV